MSETYTHRNGETEPPVMTGAYFWFNCDEDGKSSWVFGMLFVLDGFAYSAMGDKVPLEELQGQWWGPVTPSWESA